MTDSSRINLARIDHGVLPSNDLGRAFRFWAEFMGGQIGHHTNFNTRGLNREVPRIIFMTVAYHRGFGLALQDFRISPNPSRRLDGIVWGFEVAAENLDAATAEAQKQNLRCERVADYPASSPIKDSLFVLDPDGNTVELCVRKQPSDQAPQAGPVPLRRISHVRVEVTDLEQGREWYGNTFGLVVGDQVAGDDQLTMTVAQSNQLVILRKVDKVADRSTQCYKGPHVDLRSDEASYPEMLKRFNRKETYWGPDPNLIPWHEPDVNTAYGYDPFGNRIQIGIIAKRPMHHGDVARFRQQA
jgi:catechol 2,3-dioxygenase-like lactoylglutathione lyase family enzyme